MELQTFHVQNFRSIEDSGVITVAKLTALVGRNESGKSNLLLALSSLNPPTKRTALSDIKDFPRSRRLEECKPETPVVWTRWKLTPEETLSLGKLLPHAPKIETVAVGRGFGSDLWVEITADPPQIDHKKLAGVLRRLKPLLKWDVADDTVKANCEAAWTKLETAVGDVDSTPWGAT
jgi:energy-coupling factor transporter ATP-binding protein EcfA2